MSSANNKETNPFKSPVLEDEEPSIPLSTRVKRELEGSRGILNTFYKSLNLYLGNLSHIFNSLFGSREELNNQFFGGGLKVDMSNEERERLRKKNGDHNEDDIDSVDWERIKEQLLADGKISRTPLPDDPFNDEDSINHDPDGDEDQPYEEDDEWRN